MKKHTCLTILGTVGLLSATTLIAIVGIIAAGVIVGHHYYNYTIE